MTAARTPQPIYLVVSGDDNRRRVVHVERYKNWHDGAKRAARTLCGKLNWFHRLYAGSLVGCTVCRRCAARAGIKIVRVA